MLYGERRPKPYDDMSLARLDRTSSPMVHRLINIASFYFGWFACLLGATHKMPWLGVLTMAALLALHLFLTANRVQELRLILVTGLLGTSLDSLFMLNGLYTFTHHTLSWLCPAWVSALWMGFASTLNHSMRWLHGRYHLACLFGAVGGPLSYYAGVSLGALSFVPSTRTMLVVLAGVWSLVVPGLLWLAHTMSSQVNPEGP